jgi:hypothetical protein
MAIGGYLSLHAEVHWWALTEEELGMYPKSEWMTAVSDRSPS